MPLAVTRTNKKGRPISFHLEEKKTYGWMYIYTTYRKNGKTYARCNCLRCGKKKLPAKELRNIKSGDSSSCGCYGLERVQVANTTHGLKSHTLYRTYRAMVSRCYNPNNTSYRWYGGKGILVYDSWLAPISGVSAFIKYVEKALGPKPTALHSLDRVIGARGYFPGNLRWATKKEQANNRGITHVA